jgi:hypothetical protein
VSLEKTSAAAASGRCFSHHAGLTVGAVSTLATAEFGIQAGAMQRKLQLNSQQLLLAYTPYASALLGLLTLLMEPCGLWPGQGQWHGSVPNIFTYK